MVFMCVDYTVWSFKRASKDETEKKVAKTFLYRCSQLETHDDALETNLDDLVLPISLLPMRICIHRILFSHSILVERSAPRIDDPTLIKTFSRPFSYLKIRSSAKLVTDLGITALLVRVISVTLRASEVDSFKCQIIEHIHRVRVMLQD